MSGKANNVFCYPLGASLPIGKTVRQIKRMVRKDLELPTGTPMVVIRKGKTYPAPMKYRLRDGDVLEISRPPAVKCPIVKCGLCKKRHCLEHDECKPK